MNLDETVVKRCACCGRTYDLTAWRALPLLGHTDDGIDRIEQRNCASCPSTIAICVDAYSNPVQPNSEVDAGDHGVTVFNMPKSKAKQSKKVTHLSVRNPTKEVLDRIDRLVPLMAEPNIKLTRSDVVRVLLLRGLDAVEASLGM